MIDRKLAAIGTFVAVMLIAAAPVGAADGRSVESTQSAPARHVDRAPDAAHSHGIVEQTLVAALGPTTIASAGFHVATDVSIPSIERRAIDAAADHAIAATLSDVVLPRVFRENPIPGRHDGAVGVRLLAAARDSVVVTTPDQWRPRYSRLAGSLSASILTATYRQPNGASPSEVLSRWASQLALSVATREIHEFWPDIRRRLF